MKLNALMSAAALAAASLVATAANAKVYDFTFTDTVSAANTPGINAGDVFTVHLFADNGGSSLANQSWAAGDVQGFTIQAGSYSASYSQVWNFFGLGTDSWGNVDNVQFYGTGWGSSNHDNFGSWTGDTVFGDARFVDYFGRDNYIAASGFNDVREWTVAPAGVGGVPEPAAWSLMLTGFFGLGGALRARRRAMAVAL